MSLALPLPLPSPSLSRSRPGPAPSLCPALMRRPVLPLRAGPRLPRAATSSVSGPCSGTDTGLRNTPQGSGSGPGAVDPSSSPSSSPSPSGDLFARHSFVRTLEVCPGKEGPWSLLSGGEAVGQHLLAQGVFHATVRPDLPTVATLRGAFEELLGAAWPIRGGGGGSGGMVSGPKNAAGAGPAGGQASSLPASGRVPAPAAAAAAVAGAGDAWSVLTVAAQTRGLGTLTGLVRERARAVCPDGPGPRKGGALLMLSGGHPLRSVPGIKSLMPSNSLQVLHSAQRMRAQGLLPQELQLWAVENPNTDVAASLDRLQRKMEAGAQAFLLQPPLIPEHFFAWWDQAQSKGLASSTRLVVGVPVISSSKNLQFWMFLANCTGAAASACVEQFAAGERSAKGDPDALAHFREQWTLNYISLAKSLPCAAGMHVMPVSARGWRDLHNMVIDGQAFL